MRALGVLLAFALPQSAVAEPFAIGPGHEAEILALFAPHTPDRDVVRGCRFESVAIRQVEVLAQVRCGTQTGTLKLAARLPPGTLP
jgi:hypothetical protein